MEDIRKIKAVKAVTKAEFVPNIADDIDTSNYKKYALSDIAAMGSGWAAFASEFQKAVSASKGMSGLYYVDVPGTGQLFSRNNGLGYLGGVKDVSGGVGGGQASLFPVGIDPMTVMVAVALMNVEKKLGDIQEIQEEMKDFLEKREKSKQKGDLLFMTDILNNFKYNWDNEEYKKSRLIKVLDIRQSAEQNIVFYRSLVEKHLTKAGFVQLGPDVKRRIDKQVDLFNDYQLALYLYAMSSFLEIVLIDNYNSDYLDAIIKKINDYSYNYRMLYTKVFEKLDSEYRKTLSVLALKGLEKTSKGASNVADKVPGINKTTIDAKLLDAGDYLGDVKKNKEMGAMEKLVAHKGGSIKPFLDNLYALNEIYSQPIEILVDQENLYLGAG